LLISCASSTPSLPFLGVTSIATHLLSQDISVKIFDDAPYMLSIADETIDPREALGLVKKIRVNDEFKLPYQRRFHDLLKLCEDYQPELVGVSATEEVLYNAIGYLELIKKVAPNTKTILGGAFAILAPDIAISFKNVDMVALGEGEYILSDYCERIRSGAYYTNTKGIMWKDSLGSIHVNKPSRLFDINSISPMRFDLFNRERFIRSMNGISKRIIPLEVSRGCTYKCSYCASSAFRIIFRDLGRWYRQKDVQKIKSDLEEYTSRYHPDYYLMLAENFLGVSSTYLKEFARMYNRHSIPFWINTRPETIKYEYISFLKEVGLDHITIGVECGNEKYRRDRLGRKYTNECLIKAFDICRDNGVKTTANIMIGLPNETREMIFESIRLVRMLGPDNVRLAIYQPYHGTNLHQYVVENNYYDPLKINNGTLYEPIIENANMSHDELKKLLYTFRLYTLLDENQWGRVDELDIKNRSQFHELLSMINKYSA